MRSFTYSQTKNLGFAVIVSICIAAIGYLYVSFLKNTERLHELTEHIYGLNELIIRAQVNTREAQYLFNNYKTRDLINEKDILTPFSNFTETAEEIARLGNDPGSAAKLASLKKSATEALSYYFERDAVQAGDLAAYGKASDTLAEFRAWLRSAARSIPSGGQQEFIGGLRKASSSLNLVEMNLKRHLDRDRSGIWTVLAPIDALIGRLERLNRKTFEENREQFSEMEELFLKLRALLITYANDEKITAYGGNLELIKRLEVEIEDSFNNLSKVSSDFSKTMTLQLDSEVATLSAKIVEGRKAAGIVSGLIILAAIAVGWFLNKALSKRLSNLNRAIARVSSGDYATRLDTDQNDEIGGLAVSFNRMAGMIETNTALLDAKVEEKTRELSDALAKAQAANAAKSAFLANMSHEIRTPINAITGFAHLMMEDAKDDEEKERVNKVIVSADHLLGLVNDILDLSKIESDKVDLEDKPLRIGAILDNVASMAEKSIKDKGLDFGREFQPELLDLPLKGDQTRISQILANFLNNAVKFTTRGKIALRARILEENKLSVLLRFEVEDTGIGIPKESLARIFLPFEQADNTTTRKFGGTGLGLPISRKLANLMGGDVGAESIPGEGSLFWATLRLRRDHGHRKESEIPAGTKEARQQIKPGSVILLAEDNAVNQLLAKSILQRFGLLVDVADDGAKAVELAAEKSYDLIFMDMQMPVMDGLEATRKIRESGDKTPIVALTANAFKEDRDRCMEAGMNDFVSKPFVPDKILSALVRWIPG